MDENRNSDGTFAASEPLTGQAGVEADQNYRPMPEPEKPEIETQTVEEAAANLKASRQVELPQDVIEVGYQKDGERVDPNETVTFERAAKDLDKYHTSLNDTAERHVSAEFRAEVLKQRAELVAAAPETAEQLGINADETIAKAAEANPELVADQPAEPTEARQQSDAFDRIEGLEPELKEVLRKSPQARQFLESNAASANQAIETFKASVNQNQQIAQATLASLMPQLQSIPLENWAGAIQQIAQTDPVRGKLVVDTLSNWNAIQQRAELVQHYEQSQRQHEIETYRNQQNEIIDKAIPLTRVAKAEFADDLVNYVADFGVTRADLSRALEQNPAFSSAAFQKMAYDAVQYQKIMKAPKPRATPAAVPVTRPGTASHRASDNSSTVSSLQRQLAAAPSQQQQLKIAAQLLRAKRAG
jgi:hypothetical protein